MRSSRESEILALVEQRRSNKEIMRQSAINAATV
jgi:DNA-binding CsgD family transcriptional regulator